MDKKEMEAIVSNFLQGNPMELNDLVDRLYYEKGIPESEVKEAVLRLRYRGYIKPNGKWEMELTDSAADLTFL